MGIMDGLATYQIIKSGFTLAFIVLLLCLVSSFAINNIYIFESRNEIKRPVNELRDVNWIDLFQKIDLNKEKLFLEGLSETVTSEIDV